MKSAKTFSLISLSSIMLMACQNTASSQTMPALAPAPPYVTYPTAAPPTAAPAWTAPDSAPVGAIQQAADPSSAIQAYAYAHQIAPNDISVEQTYLRRMVAFGLPEMAESQANDVLQRQPTDGIAWAVTAYMHAKRDQTPEGLASIALAVKYAPQDPFVLRTAGQLVAWYDTRASKTAATAQTQGTVQSLKMQLAANPEYADAYAHAVAEYGKLGAEADVAPPGSATQTAVAPPGSATQAAVAPQSNAAAPQAAADTSAYTPAYAAPVYAAAAPDYISYPDPYDVVDPYDAWYPTPCWTADWWWPSFGAFIVIDNDFRSHHHDFDDHGHFGGDGYDHFDAGGRGRLDGTTRTATDSTVSRPSWENRATDPMRTGTAGSTAVAAPAGQTARVTAPAFRTSSGQASRSIAMPAARSAATAAPQEPRWEFPRATWSASQVTPRVAAPDASVPQFSQPRLSGGRDFAMPSGFSGGRDFGGGSGGAPHFSGGGGGGGMHISGGGGGGRR